MLHLNAIALDYEEFCWQEEDKSLLTLTCSFPGLWQPRVKSCCRQSVWSVFGPS